MTFLFLAVFAPGLGVACGLSRATSSRPARRPTIRARWRKGRLLRKQLLGAFVVYGSLGVLLWWSLG
jgi:hypothetical protein